MINKIIHQIWVGKYPLPERETRLSKEIKEKHPNYEYHLWTDDNLPEIPERLKDMYELMYSKKDLITQYIVDSSLILLSPFVGLSE